MQHYRLNPLWTLAVFLAAFLFYLITACYVLYPGASATFLTTLTFPEQLPVTMADPMDKLVYWACLRFVGLSHTISATAVLSAFLGALTITCLFRAAIAGVRIACLDHATLPDKTRLRAQVEDNITALLVGLSVALLGLVSLPMWATATRPLPGTCTTLLTMATLMLALGVRWRCALNYFYTEKPGFKSKILIAATFALSACLLLLSPTMLPFVIFAMMLSGWIIVQPELDGRIGYVYSAIFGLVLGALLSFMVIVFWKNAFLPADSGDATMLWIAHLKQFVPAILSLFTNFEGICQATLCIAAIALYLGCFPYSYLDFGRPVIGQIALFVLFALTFVQWPSEFWMTLAEPTSLATCGNLFLVLTLGLLIGSWVRNWYDAHITWKRSRANGVACVILFAPMVLFIVGTIVCHGRSAAGRASQAELEVLWAEMDKSLPQTTTVWWNPDPQLYGVLLNRALTDKTIHPLTSFQKDLSRLTIDGKTFEQLCNEDPVLAALSPHGPVALTAYLFHIAADEINVGTLPAENAGELDCTVDALATSSFAETPIGQQTIAALRAQIARVYVISAHHVSPEEAAVYLRRAVALDPKNISAIVSLTALAEEADVTITEEERLAAADIIEHNDHIRAPTPEFAHKLGLQYGPVRSKQFHAALRLHRLLMVDRDVMFKQLCDLYRRDVTSLVPRERNLAILILPEEEAGQLLLARTPTVDELRIYLCAYPQTELSEQLWAANQSRLQEEAKGIFFLRQRMKDGTRQQLLNRAHTFFQDSKSFAYALFYVKGLIEDGRLRDAENFVAGFKVKEHLGATPCLAEYLRVLVAKALVNEDATAAISTLQTWLQNDPRQMTLWSVHLTNPALQIQHKRLMSEVYRCLQHYPYHRVASRQLEAELRATSGDEVAQRYRDAVNATRLDALNDEDGYVHR